MERLPRQLRRSSARSQRELAVRSYAQPGETGNWSFARERSSCVGQAYGRARGDTASKCRPSCTPERRTRRFIAFRNRASLWNATRTATLRVANRIYTERGLPIERGS